MNKTAHSIISATVGLSLAAFTAISFVSAGIAAPATVLGISALTIYGLAEIAMLDYTPVTVRRMRAASRNESVCTNLVKFPVAACRRHAA